METTEGGTTVPLEHTLRYGWNLIAPHTREAVPFHTAFTGLVSPQVLASRAISFIREVTVGFEGSIVGSVTRRHAIATWNGTLRPDFAYWVRVNPNPESLATPVVGQVDAGSSPTRPPHPPSGVTATAGNGQATVTWSPSASDGGSPIVFYRVSSNPGGFTATTTATTTTVTGLANGTEYSFTVTATNAAGASAPSAASNTVTPVTDVGGSVAVDTTWSLAGSPYVVTADIVVDQGARLTVESGVTVMFDAGKTLVVNGELVARGTSSTKVTFTSSAGTPSKGDWGYIKFGDTSTDATFDGGGAYVSGSVLEHCVVEFGGGVGSSGQLLGAVWADSASPSVSECDVRSSAVNGVRVTPGEGLRFTNNRLTFNNGPGLVATGTVSLGQDALFTISGNVVADNGSSTYGALVVQLEITGAGVATTAVSKNTITDNAVSGAGLELGGSGNSFVVSENVVLGNAASGISACCDNEFVITDNLIFGNAAGGVQVLATFSGRTTTISSNRIVQNTAQRGGGIKAEADNGGAVVVLNNILDGNTTTLSGDGAALWLEDRTKGISVTGNTMSSNAGSSLIYINCNGGDCVNNQDVPRITGNNLQNNTTTHWLYNSTDAGSASVDATNNWWGTTDDTAIQALIHDKNDDPARGGVTYVPYLGAPSTTTPLSAPINVTVDTVMTSLSLTWATNLESDVIGYKVHWDTDPSGSSYANSLDVGAVTSATVTGLVASTTYYVAVTAYDNDVPANESWFSTQVVAVTLEDFATVLDIALQALKSITPAARVTTNLGGGPLNEELLKSWELYFDDIYQDLDVISLDLYPDDNAVMIGQLDDIVDRFQKRYQKPVSIAEIGMCVDIERFNEVQQANYLQQYLAELGGASTTPESVFIYEIQDNSDAFGCGPNFGLRRDDGTERASWETVMSAVAAYPQVKIGVTSHIFFEQGTNLDLDTFKTNVDNLAARGVRSIRVGPAVYEVMTIQGDAVVFDTVDLDKLGEALTYAKSKGMEVTLWFIPPWSDTLTYADYLKIVQLTYTEMAVRFADKIDLWQLHNEPNISIKVLSGSGPFAGGPGVTAQSTRGPN